MRSSATSSPASWSTEGRWPPEMSSDNDVTQPTTAHIHLARSWLFVPGDRPDRFAKAAASGADLVVCDLEDAVSAKAKTSARAHVAEWLRSGGLACVRVNAPGTPFHVGDVAALSGLPGLRAVMVPKAEDPRVLAELSDALGPQTAVVALVETALGVHRTGLPGGRGERGAIRTGHRQRLA